MSGVAHIAFALITLCGFLGPLTGAALIAAWWRRERPLDPGAAFETRLVIGACLLISAAYGAAFVGIVL